jgi:transposase
MIRAEKNRAATARDPWIIRQIARIVRTLKRNLEAVEAEIAALLKASKQLGAEVRQLRSAPGVGPLVSATLVARLPELGRLDRRRIAALAGLAPHARDSGLFRGKRQIWGGRADVRRALYIAAFVATSRDPGFKALRQRLQAAGKPFKVAITACARKLLTILNAMARAREDYRQQI